MMSIQEPPGEEHRSLAAITESKNIVGALLDNGADISARDGRGRTALHMTAKCKHLAMVERFLEGGADISAKNKLGETLLWEVECSQAISTPGIYDKIRQLLVGRVKKLRRERSTLG